MFGNELTIDGVRIRNWSAAWPNVASSRFRNSSCSIFFSPFVSHACGRWLRWSLFSNTVSFV